MVLMTMIARLVDGLPLAASMQENEQLGKGIVEYQNQAKRLFRTLNSDSPSKCSIESGPYLFHYFMDQGACFLTLCDRNFNKKLAYSFLEDIAEEFHAQFGDKIHVANRPYAFIEFDTYIQKAKRNYMEGRGKRHLSAINMELQGVQRIMVQNMDDVLQRGAILSELDNKAQNLSMMSAKYKKDTSALNATSWKAIGIGSSILFFFFIIWYKVF
uniref:Vesicle-trafficking protein SEC22b-B n=1 Tax=Caligus rogercresseyi TaxID=217165 RepID=C1BPJ5_CALRO|nr:Vesicle-trafficking protein SEC22b-B [Caligus rogercresseyi]|eukprot:TRINITY_DN2633_c0_g1_i1.p1 TRINITY_DN2633_c0_g1~~TRINITY_DN2633_c0_g1_i1.p1  ORF type:complete len:214 (+),score=77.21 TRINITY_DN2633_c0_g1_i1:135-776(+)